MAKDADYASVVLGMHMDGINGGLSFPDIKGRSITLAGDAKTSTAQSKFGGASLRLDGSGDYLYAANHADFAFGSGDFTVEAWIYVQATTGSNQCLMTYWQAGGYAWQVYLSADAQTACFAMNTDQAQLYGTKNFIGQWSHIAVTRNGSTFRLFVDGVLKQSASSSQTIVATTAPLYIGTVNGGTWNFNGYIDDLRITKGVARYTATFTPPAEAFPNGGYEVAGVVTDASSNPVSRIVRAYRRSDGALLGQATSNSGTGAYSIAIAANTEVQVVMLDDDAGTLENDQILRTIPV